MYKKILVLIGILMLTINTAIWAVNFSATTKADYQKRFNNLLNKASSYTYISGTEKASYQKYINETLNTLEQILNNPNIPESDKVKMLNSFNSSISSMESSINNPNIPASQKVAGIKTVLQGMQTSIAQNTAYQQEELARKKKLAEEQSKWEAQQAAIQKREAEKKAESERMRIEDEEDLKKLQQGTKVIREYAHFYKFKMRYATNYYNSATGKANMSKVYSDFCSDKGEKVPSRQEIAELISVFMNVKINPNEPYKYTLNNIHPDRKYITEIFDVNRMKHFSDLRENGDTTDIYVRAKGTTGDKNLGVRLTDMGYYPVSFPTETDPFREEHSSMYIMCIPKK